MAQGTKLFPRSELNNGHDDTTIKINSPNFRSALNSINSSRESIWDERRADPNEHRGKKIRSIYNRYTG